MARKLDEAPFRPIIPEGERSYASVRKLAEALYLIYRELEFQLSSLGAENFNRGGLESLASALSVPRLWSGFESGELVPAGTLVICSGVTAKLWIRYDGVPVERDNDADLALVSHSSDLIDRLAREVIRGLWGNGSERKRRLTEAVYDYQAVQNRVNELLR